MKEIIVTQNLLKTTHAKEFLKNLFIVMYERNYCHTKLAWNDTCQRICQKPFHCHIYERNYCQAKLAWNNTCRRICEKSFLLWYMTEIIDTQQLLETIHSKEFLRNLFIVIYERNYCHTNVAWNDTCKRICEKPFHCDIWKKLLSCKTSLKRHMQLPPL